jgi:4-hydroxy-tetrahydrodipicolinate reductase
MNIAIAGSTGRTGGRTAELARAADFDAVATPMRGEPLPEGVDVLIDFTQPEGMRRWLGLCRAAKVSFVSGTTGLTADDYKLLDEAATDIPVLHATNTSIGVAVFNRLAGDAAKLLGGGFQMQIVETHHVHKKDAPSGTAITLADAVERAVQRRPIIESVREGDVVGTHALSFSTGGERLELTHAALSRDTFAAGALRCARWLAGRPAGRYTVDDVLFGSDA